MLMFGVGKMLTKCESVISMDSLRTLPGIFSHLQHVFYGVYFASYGSRRW